MFLKLEVNKKYKIRLVSKPLAYYQHWEPVICRSPGIDKATGQVIDPLMLQNFEPKLRYAIWVLDRNDNNQLKIMDFSPTLYDKFVNWKTTFNDDPGGANGPDWVIEGKCPGSDKRRTKWEATHLDRTPYTAEELERCKAGVTFNDKTLTLKEKLAEVRREHTPDEIRAMLVAKNADGGAVAPARTVQAAPAVQARPAAPAAPAAPAPAAPAATKPANDNIDF
jgi:hypothetical protein